MKTVSQLLDESKLESARHPHQAVWQFRFWKLFDLRIRHRSKAAILAITLLAQKKSRVTPWPRATKGNSRTRSGQAEFAKRGVGFGSDQKNQIRRINPQHQHDKTSQRAINFGDIGAIRDVQIE